MHCNTNKEGKEKRTSRSRRHRRTLFRSLFSCCLSFATIATDIWHVHTYILIEDSTCPCAHGAWKYVGMGLAGRTPWVPYTPVSLRLRVKQGRRTADMALVLTPVPSRRCDEGNIEASHVSALTVDISPRRLWQVRLHNIEFYSASGMRARPNMTEPSHSSSIIFSWTVYDNTVLDGSARTIHAALVMRLAHWYIYL